MLHLRRKTLPLENLARTAIKECSCPELATVASYILVTCTQPNTRSFMQFKGSAPRTVRLSRLLQKMQGLGKSRSCCTCHLPQAKVQGVIDPFHSWANFFLLLYSPLLQFLPGGNSLSSLKQDGTQLPCLSLVKEQQDFPCSLPPEKEQHFFLLVEDSQNARDEEELGHLSALRAEVWHGQQPSCSTAVKYFNKWQKNLQIAGPSSPWLFWKTQTCYTI